ncbi:MAG: hypothetical protein BWY98_00096 [Tenericutes bacterium ADurb.BinA155]|nr:MAG: hypothetical protein BWY98_00096 [Tenericutes bacterium ADurb.BinA155]
MKVMLYALLDNGAGTETLLRDLSEKGFNGTVLPASSVHHVLHHGNPGTAVFSLADYAEDVKGPSLMAIFVLDKKKLPELQGVIRAYTENFKKIHGGMFVVAIDEMEGSF